MLADFVDEAPVQETFAIASEALSCDLWQLAAEGPEAALNQTHNTQPVLLAASIALWQLWLARGGAKPGGMAGHSLGEYSALVAAGAIELPAAVRLVRRRGELMQAAVPTAQGAMAAILGLAASAVSACCVQVAEATNSIVSAANFNAPGQVVIAGAAEAVEEAIAACLEAGGKKAMRLSVSVPSHCALMQPAADAFAEELSAVIVCEPDVPVVHNVDATASGDVAGIRERLLAQLVAPVLWTDSIQALQRAGINGLVECGPGRVLGSLAKRIDRALTNHTLADAANFTSALQQVK